MKDNLLYQFNNFQFEVRERRLKRNQEIIALTPKAFETLLVLIQNRGQVVEKEFLLARIWGETFVEEATLTRNISTLRKILGRQPNGKSFIETVPRYGYRFVAEVKEINNSEEITAGQKQFQTSTFSGNEIDKSDTRKLSHTNITKTNPKSLKTGLVKISEQINFHLRAIILIGIILLIGSWLFASYINRTPSLASSKFERISFSKLTTSGDIERLALSPDGKYLAYVESKNENPALMLRQIADENLIEIIPPKKQQYIGITFSPDGGSIYYVVQNPDNANLTTKSILYKVSLFGGATEKILEDVDSPVAISPITKQIAFIRNYPNEEESALIVADSLGKSEHKVSSRNNSENFATQKGGLAWSPDEGLIVSPAFVKDSAKQEMQLIAIHTENGRQETLTSQKWTWVGQPAWLKDGSGVVFPANNEQLQKLTDGIWTVSYPTGNLRQISGDVNGFFGISLTADSDKIAAVQSDRLTTFWADSIENRSLPSKIAQSFSELSFFPLGISYSPDGKIVYALAKNGNIDIWSMNANGSNQRQLTSNNASDFEPVVSIDGRFIFYLSNQAGRQNIWCMNSDGTDARQLTDNKNTSSPSVTADGKWIYYTVSEGTDNQQSFVWKMPADGGMQKQITFVQTSQPKISPDGKFIGCYYPSVAESGNNSGRLKLTILTAEDGKVVRQFDETPVRNESSLAWTADGKALIFLKNNNNVSNLWLQSVADNSPRQLTYSNDNIVRFAVSSDEKTLVYEKGLLINNIVLIHEP